MKPGAFHEQVFSAIDRSWLPPEAPVAEGLSPAALSESQCLQRSLLAFVEAAWGVVEPNRRYVGNWHIAAICQHLEAVSLGTLSHVLVNVPPGTMKSLLVSVFWPAWEWIVRPELRYLCASYGQDLATRDNRRCRDLIQSLWYQAYWPHVQLREDQNQKTRYDTTAGGWRIGTSVGGRGTGEHPDRIIVDDPHTAEQANSQTERQTALDWFDQTIAPRGVSRGARQVVIMQRLHQADLSGHILEQGGTPWVHLCLPMRAEPDRMPQTPLGWNDPRPPGELLWPAIFPESTVKQLEGTMLWSAAGQLQQRPAPLGGGLFRRDSFPIVDAMPSVPLVRCRAWDCAATPGGGDYTAGVRMARDAASGRIYVEHVIRGQWSAGQVDALIRQVAKADGVNVSIREEQEGGSAGKAVVEARTRALAGYIYSGVPSTGDKVTRAKPFAVQAEAGNVSLVRGEWNQDWLDELSLFPFGAHDDQVDASAAAFAEICVVMDYSSEIRHFAGLGESVTVVRERDPGRAPDWAAFGAHAIDGPGSRKPGTSGPDGLG